VNVEAQKDFVLACWGRFLELSHSTPEDPSSARSVLEEGREALIHLRDAGQLTTEEMEWLRQFETAIGKLSAGRLRAAP
jgi:hypothetical protein